jgi:hypothetical protein
MVCKEGYEPKSPLCALCKDGYYEQLRKCTECKEPRITLLVGLIVGLIAGVAFAAHCWRKYSKYLSPTLMTHFKILVASVTILSTIGR